MDLNGYPFNLLGFVIYVGSTALCIEILWPILEFLGQLTGTGWVGGIIISMLMTLVPFIQVAREYSKHREDLQP